MTAGRELVPAQTIPARSTPSRGELLRLLRQLRALYFTDMPIYRHVARAYGASHALGDHRIAHRIDLQL